MLTQLGMSYPVPVADFESDASLRSSWSLAGQDFTVAVNGPAPQGAPFNESLEVNATLVQGQTSTEGQGEESEGGALPGGQLFFAMTQTFQWVSGPPIEFDVSSWFDPLQMRNVTTIYVDYVIANPADNFSLSTVQLGLIYQNVVLTNESLGKWLQSQVPSADLPLSELPGFSPDSNPAAVVFNGTGTYKLTVEILAVPDGRDPAISLLVGGTSLQTVSYSCGISGTSSLSIAGTVELPNGTEPVGVGVDPNTHRLYVAAESSGGISPPSAVYVISEVSDSIVATIPVDNITLLSSLAVDAENDLVFVTASTTIVSQLSHGNLVVINGATNQVQADIPVGPSASGIAVDPATGLVYLANYVVTHPTGAGTLTVIDEGSEKVVATINTTDSVTWSASLDTSTDTVYVSSGGLGPAKPGGESGILVVSGATDLQTGNVSLWGNYSDNTPLAAYPVAIAVNPSTDRVYATIDGFSGQLLVVGGASNTVIGSVAIGDAGTYAAVNPVADMVYVVASYCRALLYDLGGACPYQPDTVYAVDGATDKVVGNLTLAGALGPVTVDPDTGAIYVAGPESGVTVIKDSTSAPASSSSASQAGGQEVPELPFQPAAAALTGLSIILSYLGMKSRQRRSRERSKRPT
jgi:DNA-binding beta-propeller fold protein YncE